MNFKLRVIFHKEYARKKYMAINLKLIKSFKNKNSLKNTKCQSSTGILLHVFSGELYMKHLFSTKHFVKPIMITIIYFNNLPYNIHF